MKTATAKPAAQAPKTSPEHALRFVREVLEYILAVNELAEDVAGAKYDADQDAAAECQRKQLVVLAAAQRENIEKAYSIVSEALRTAPAAAE